LLCLAVARWLAQPLPRHQQKSSYTTDGIVDLDHISHQWFECNDISHPCNMLQSAAGLLGDTLYVVGGDTKDYHFTDVLHDASLNNFFSCQFKWQRWSCMSHGCIQLLLA